jgi:hypothetical protein
MKTRLFLIAGALVAGSLSFSHSAYSQESKKPAAETTNSVDDLIRAAMEVSKNNNVLQSEAAFKKVLQHPQLTPAQRYQVHSELLRVYTLRRDLSRMERTLKQILQIPELTPAQQQAAKFALGDVLRERRLTNDAMDIWQDLLQTPTISLEERASVMKRVATQLRAQRKYAEAEAIVREAVALEGLSSALNYDLLVLLGQVILDQRQNATAADAEKILREATFMEGITPEQRYSAVLLLANAIDRLQRPSGTFASPVDNVYYDKWLDLSIADFRKVLELGGLSHQQQIELHRLLANLQLEKMDIDGANETLAAAVAIPSLEPKDYIQARYNQAVVFIRQLEPEKGKQILDEIIATENYAANPRAESVFIIERALLEDGVDAQIEYAKKHSLDALKGVANRLRGRGEGPMRAQNQVYNVILSDTEAPLNERWGAYVNMMGNLLRVDDYEEAKRVYAQYADYFYNQDSKYAHFAPLLSNPYARSTHVRANEFMADVEFARWLSETFADKPIPDRQKVVFYDYIINAANQERDFKRVKTYARKMLDEFPDLDVAQRLRWLVTIAVIDAGNKPDQAAKAVHATLRAQENLEPAAYVQALLAAGQYAMLMRNYDVAERMLAEHNKMLVDEPKRSINLTFIKDGPRDISEFISSEYFQDAKNRAVLDRRYSGNLQILMDTDTATSGREMTTESGEVVTLDTGGSGGAGASKSSGASSVSREHTVFTASCDDAGVYIFFYIPVDPARARQIREGATSVGSFEITLAEGFHAPYSCFIVRGPTNAAFSDKFITQYNNRNYRAKLASENTKVEYRVLPDAVVMLMSFTWDAFVKIPQNGDKWYFEPIHWENGGWTWGGSRSVHWRETQGELVFDNLTPENLTSIKRRQLFRAKENFLNEASHRNNGYIEIWKDNELGDQQFYSVRVEDFNKQYQDYARRIRADMTDEEVNEIFDAAYDAMINAKYIVAEQRYQYLMEKLTTE